MWIITDKETNRVLQTSETQLSVDEDFNNQYEYDGEVPAIEEKKLHGAYQTYDGVNFGVVYVVNEQLLWKEISDLIQQKEGAIKDFSYKGNHVNLTRHNSEDYKEAFDEVREGNISLPIKICFGGVSFYEFTTMDEVKDFKLAVIAHKLAINDEYARKMDEVKVLIGDGAEELIHKIMQRIY